MTATDGAKACATCHGRGWVPGPLYNVACDDCDGDGKQPEGAKGEGAGEARNEIDRLVDSLVTLGGSDPASQIEADQDCAEIETIRLRLHAIARKQQSPVGAGGDDPDGGGAFYALAQINFPTVSFIEVGSYNRVGVTEALRRIIAALARPGKGGGGEWIRCSERMPEDGLSVIVSATCGCCDATWMCSAYWDAERGWDFDGDGAGGMGQWKVTHWRPLPPPPGEALARGGE